MTLEPGVRVGRYEVVSPLGAGGMGEVYRARDPHLGREVALKVVAGEEPSAERLRRFEQEARAVAALRHPHILGVHDVGVHEGRPYLVLELLEGETLGQRLARDRLPLRKALDVASQVCSALGAAHGRGIVHRDLKPDNLFLAPEGVKVLDFGLAKLSGAAGSDPEAGTATATEPGGWFGTAGYVSPEQLRGQPASSRSDVFALGAVLYEMLTGRRAFKGATRADSLSAILHQDPPAMPTDAAVPPALERVVRRCLEKDPEDRFQSARDVAFALEAFSGPASEAASKAIAAAVPHARRWGRPLAAVLVGVALVAGGALAERKLLDRQPPTFRPLTFRRGWMSYARFAPDGGTIVYAAAWEGRPLALFQTRTDNVESRPLAVPQADLLSVSSRGEMALRLFTDDLSLGTSTLAVAPVGGTTPPRELLTHVYEADWLPDGKDLLIARRRTSETTLELPPGNVIHHRSGYAEFLRVSPDGRYAAFRDGPNLELLDLARRSTRTLLAGIGPVTWGLAWAPSGREVWFTEGVRSAKDVVAVDLEGRRRLVYRSAVDLSLMDISADGRALLHRSLCRDSVTVSMLPAREVEDLSVVGVSLGAVLSADGRQLLIAEEPAGAAQTYLRAAQGEPVRLAEGYPMDVSPDGRTTLVLQGLDVAWVPVGPGLPQKLQTGIGRPRGALFIPPDGSRVLVWGREPDAAPTRLVVAQSGGGAPRVVMNEPPGASFVDADLAVSPDGHFAAGRSAKGTLAAFPLDVGKAHELGSVPAGYRIIRWTGDGRGLLLGRLGATCQIARLDLGSRRFVVLRDVPPRDPVGVTGCRGVTASADASAYAAVYTRCLTDLVLAEGLR